jgi:putative Holliday junction resolvase
LDLGEARCGVAVSDPSATIATPVAILPTHQVLTMGSAFRQLLDDYQPALLVFGLPLSMDGAEHGQAARIREMAAQVAAASGLPYQFCDERLSSVSAWRSLGGRKKKTGNKIHIDDRAAAVILQAFLDRRTQTSGIKDEPAGRQPDNRE